MNTLLLITNIAISAYLLYKVRKIHIGNYSIKAEISNIDSSLFKQIQSYHQLIQLIQPIKPLPMLRGWAASPDFLTEIATHTLENKPNTILECSSGASTLILARSCEINGLGHVYSLEHDQKYAQKTLKTLQANNLEKWVTIIHAPLEPLEQLNKKVWYSIDGLNHISNHIDMIVVDGPPENTDTLARHPAVPILYKLMSDTCTLFLDDASRSDEKEILKLWKHEFPDLLQEFLPFEKGCSRLYRKK